ncbi:MAG: MauE/DoxX family redox-associated membrane protein [Acidimicrobiales bacterium]
MSAAGVGYAAAVALAAIFAIAAVAKLRDVAATEREFLGLGLPRASFFARFIPLVELSIVLLLLIVPPAGAIAALISLAFFTTFLIGRLRAGVRAPCACFGAAKAKPISTLDVFRNLGMILLAILSLGTEKPTPISLLDALVVAGSIAAVGVLLRLAGKVRTQ